MSMMTMTNKKRPAKKGALAGTTWQVWWWPVPSRVPQAADAATGSKTCGNDGYSCSTTVTAKKGYVTFRAANSPYSKASTNYTVKIANGAKICSGKITFNGGSETCSTAGYKGRVTITVGKSWSSGARISTTY